MMPFVGRGAYLLAPVTRTKVVFSSETKSQGTGAAVKLSPIVESDRLAASISVTATEYRQFFEVGVRSISGGDAERGFCENNQHWGRLSGKKMGCTVFGLS